jgi:death on curing protein
VEYLWLSIEIVIALHGELLDEHGGPPGPPKAGALESTLARPQQLLAYGDPPPNLARLAACYAYGVATNHCFPDGDKRAALAALDVFLRLNDHKLIASEMEAVVTIEAVAAGRMSEQKLAAWIARSIAAL